MLKSFAGCVWGAHINGDSQPHFALRVRRLSGVSGVGIISLVAQQRQLDEINSIIGEKTIYYTRMSGARLQQ